MRRKIARLALVGSLAAGLVAGGATAAQASSYHFWNRWSSFSQCDSDGSFRTYVTHQWQGYQCYHNLYYGSWDEYGLY